MYGRFGKDKQQFIFVGYEKISGLFTSPSIFAPANLRIVRRSNALLNNLYGKSACSETSIYVLHDLQGALMLESADSDFLHRNAES